MMWPSDPKRMLIIQTASIGDVILSTPVAEKLHAFYPSARLDMLIKKGNESLFTRHPFLHRILIWDKSSGKYKNLRNLIREIRSSNYDLVVNLQRFASTGMITALSGAGVTAGFNKNPFSNFFTIRGRHRIGGEGIHEVDRNLSLIEKLTDDSSFPVRLYPTAEDMARTSQFKTKAYITISPASLWFTKQFPVEKWVAFVRGADPSLHIYFLGSGNDREMCDEIIKISGHKNSLNLAGKLGLLESAALMRDAQMNFMNDSAPLHLASAVNARTTAVFCSTVGSFGFGPLAEDAVIVETEEHLDCRPCGLHGHRECPEGHFKCALTIDETRLLKRITA